MITSKKTFIDTCVIINMYKAKREIWLHYLLDYYEEVIIVKEVISELRNPIEEEKVRKLIESKKIKLFDPDEDLDEIDGEIYDSIFDEVKKAFDDYQKTRTHKKTLDIGDISILSAARFLNVGIITTEDKDFPEVISEENYKVTLEKMNDEQEKENIDIDFEIHGNAEIGVILRKEYDVSRQDFRNYLKQIYPGNTPRRTLILEEYARLLKG